ncbi:MAG TPA: DEAD/DEAH box helicase [Polyangiales bacterium]|nr:DEAD/DEAH box helicase [Polyangiales bacterium]
MQDPRAAGPDSEQDLDAALSAVELAEAALHGSVFETARLTRPVVRLFQERLWVNRGDALRPDFEEIEAPVIELAFEYPGMRIACNDPQRRFFCAGSSGPRTYARDQVAETRARHMLESFGAIDLECLDDYGVAPDSAAHYLLQLEETGDARCAFTAYALPQLRALGFGVELAQDYPYQVLTDEPPWYARLDENGTDSDWFSLELGVEIDGHRVNLLPVLLGMLEDGYDFEADGGRRAGKRFVQVPGRSCYLPVPEERLRILLQVMAELYQGLGCEREVIQFPSVRAAALADLEVAFDRPGAHLELEAPPELQARARGLAGAAKAPPVAAAHGLRASLRPYQAAGLAWLQQLREHSAGGVLADDMGLGKTLQTIAHLCLEKESGRAQLPSLIVTPTSLIGNWQRELEKFAPSLRVSVLTGPQRHAHRPAANSCDVCLVSYPILLRDAEYFEAQSYYYVILDEAQTIKNRRSRAHELATSLRSEHRLCLTGTPIENSLEELWSLFDFLMPGLLGDELAFRQFYRVPIEQHRDDSRLATLRAQVTPYVLRRMKRDVAKELPPKTEIVRPVELRGKQRELYESIRVSAHSDVRAAIRKRGIGASTLTILDALMRLRQLCCDPRLLKSEAARFVRESAKYELFFELLEQLLRDGHRVLVFSQFTSMLALLAHGLRERGLGYATLTGATLNRQKQVDDFERGRSDVFLISLKAGGTGLNLTSADSVIHYDPWWNPAAQDQATDRAYRIGQTKPVFVYNLVAAGSVEERMLGLQQRKRLLADSVLGAPAQASRGFAPDEVELLFSPLVD